MPAYIVKIRKKDDLNNLPGIQKNGTTVYKIRLNNNNNENHNNSLYKSKNSSYSICDEWLNKTQNPLCAPESPTNHHLSTRTRVITGSKSVITPSNGSDGCDNGAGGRDSVYLNESLRPLGYSVEKRTIRVSDLASKMCSVVGRTHASKVSSLVLYVGVSFVVKKNMHII